jgi:cellulose synthase operon protein C
MLGSVYEKSDDGATNQWYVKAKEWYDKARHAHPDDFSIVRGVTGFYHRTRQMDKVEAQCDAILKDSHSQSAETVAWARRTLALTLAASTDAQKIHRALFVLDSNRQATEDPEDLRALAYVLDAHKTIEHSKRAIKVLESLIDKNLAKADDRFLLARLYEVNGDWPKARETYRELNLRTKTTRDIESLNHRPLYLGELVAGLLRNHKGSDDQQLVEAQDLVDELKQLQPDQLRPVVLEVQVTRARNQLDKALELIQTSAKRSDLTPIAIRGLAELVEALGRFDIAERLYQRYAALPNIQDGKYVLAEFLGRRGDVKGALDVCEPLWANPRNAERAAAICIAVIDSPKADSRQVDRVAGWLEQAIEQRTDSAILLLGLGNCRERQEHYEAAKQLYARVIEQSSRNGVASSQTNSLIATSYNNLAWLLALNENKGNDALVEIDRAINLAGQVPDFLDTRGVVYLNLKKTQDAINDLEMAVRANPSPARLFHLTQAYLQAGNRAKAKEYWKAAMDKKLDQIRSGSGGFHPLEQSAYQKVLSELGSS